MITYFDRADEVSTGLGEADTAARARQGLGQLPASGLWEERPGEPVRHARARTDTTQGRQGQQPPQPEPIWHFVPLSDGG